MAKKKNNKKPQEKPKGKSFSSRFLSPRKIIAAILVVFGLWQGWDFMSPRISLEPSHALNEYDAFSKRFILSNDGKFAIYDIQISCEVDTVKLSRGGLVHGNLINMPPITKLSAKQKTPVSCAAIALDMPNRTEQSDWTTVISFRPYLVWLWRTEERYRFVGTLDSKGQFLWFPERLTD